MKIEQGKCYRSATGVKVGPMYDGGLYWWPEEDGLGYGPMWYKDGTPENDEASEIGALVAEWEDAPQDDEWSEWEEPEWVHDHPAFYDGCVCQTEWIDGEIGYKYRIKLRQEDKPAQDPAPRFTDDEINRIAKAVADAVAAALRDS
jgi:hypothetical protein